MENIYNPIVYPEAETCVIENDPLPPFFIEETIDYEGHFRVHGYYDLDEAKSDFTNFKADMTILAASLYCNPDGDPYCIDVFSHRNDFVQAEIDCVFSENENEKVKSLFIAWLEENDIAFHCFSSDDDQDEIHVYCVTDCEVSNTVKWLNSHKILLS